MGVVTEMNEFRNRKYTRPESNPPEPVTELPDHLKHYPKPHLHIINMIITVPDWDKPEQTNETEQKNTSE